MSSKRSKWLNNKNNDEPKIDYRYYRKNKKIIIDDSLGKEDDT